MSKYYLIIFDKNHVGLKDIFLKTITDYPFSKNFLYFVYKVSDKGNLIPFCKVEKCIIDMTFTNAFNFNGYFN